MTARHTLTLLAASALTLLGAPAVAHAQWTEAIGLETAGYLRAEPYFFAVDDGASHEAGRFELQSSVAARPADILTISTDLALVLQADMGLQRGSGQHSLLINEAWVELAPGLGASVLIGKRRLPWGAGFADRPTDLLNPAPNPFEPSLLREGAWVVAAQWAWEVWSVDLVYSPTVDEASGGWPDGLHAGPSESIFAGRVAVTAAETDLSVVYTLEREHHRAGLTAARYVTDDLELHGELLVRDDSPFPIPDAPSLLTRMLEHDDEAPSVEALLGAHYYHPDLGLDVTAEVEYFGAGLTADDFDRVLELVQLASTLGVGAPTDTAAFGGANGGAQISALRQLYAIGQVRYVQFESDWQLGVGARVGLEDGSTVVFPSIERRLGDATTFGLGAFVLLSPDDAEFSLIPLQWAGFGRLTSYF